jgi:ferredoxin
MPEDDQLTVLDRTSLQVLLDVLRERGHLLLGPVVRDGAVVPGEISTLEDLPRGVHDTQAPGRYRLRTGPDAALFGHAAVATCWKAQLFPARLLLWQGERGPDGFTVRVPSQDPPRLALIGVRACDLRAIAVHDRVLGERAVTDPDYLARRERIFLVAVDCACPAATCFCTDTGGGPRAQGGFDLCLTELLDEPAEQEEEPAEPGGHRFLVRTGSAGGEQVLAEVLGRVPGGPASAADRAAAARQAERATAAIRSRLDTTGLRDLLYDNVEHARWDDVAARCLACGNCTLACPTCFCTSADEQTDLTGGRTARYRTWDSCFTEDFSYLHGGSVRSSTGSRYRQWITHKLAAWTDQFGTLGCVGCGRCITWCPVGIDLTEEVAAIRAHPRAAAAAGREA